MKNIKFTIRLLFHALAVFHPYCTSELKTLKEHIHAQYLPNLMETKQYLLSIASGIIIQHLNCLHRLTFVNCMQAQYHRSPVPHFLCSPICSRMIDTSKPCIQCAGVGCIIPPMQVRGRSLRALSRNDYSTDENQLMGTVRVIIYGGKYSLLGVHWIRVSATLSTVQYLQFSKIVKILEYPVMRL